MIVSEVDEDRYDEEKLPQTDNKHKEVASMTSSLEKDIAHTKKDVESSQNENFCKAGNASNLQAEAAEILKEKYKKIARIGEGSHGTAYLVQSKLTSQLWVIKTINKSWMLYAGEKQLR